MLARRTAWTAHPRTAEPRRIFEAKRPLILSSSAFDGQNQLQPGIHQARPNRAKHPRTLHIHHMVHPCRFAYISSCSCVDLFPPTFSTRETFSGALSRPTSLLFVVCLSAIRCRLELRPSLSYSSKTPFQRQAFASSRLVALVLLFVVVSSFFFFLFSSFVICEAAICSSIPAADGGSDPRYHDDWCAYISSCKLFNMEVSNFYSLTADHRGEEMLT